jgi:hypothetical protein
MTLSDEVKIRLAQDSIRGIRELAVSALEERVSVSEMKQVLYLSEQVLFLTKQYENAYVFQKLSIMNQVAKYMEQIDSIINTLTSEDDNYE